MLLNLPSYASPLQIYSVQLHSAYKNKGPTNISPNICPIPSIALSLKHTGEIISHPLAMKFVCATTNLNKSKKGAKTILLILNIIQPLANQSCLTIAATPIKIPPVNVANPENNKLFRNIQRYCW